MSIETPVYSGIRKTRTQPWAIMAKVHEVNTRDFLLADRLKRVHPNFLLKRRSAVNSEHPAMRE